MDKDKKSVWTRIGMVIGGIILVLMSGTGMIGTITNGGDEEATYKTLSPIVQGLVDDSGECAEEIAAIKADLFWLKRLTLGEIRDDMSLPPRPTVEVRRPNAYRALEEVKEKIEKKADLKDSEPGELPDFDMVQKAFK